MLVLTSAYTLRYAREVASPKEVYYLALTISALVPLGALLGSLTLGGSTVLSVGVALALSLSAAVMAAGATRLRERGELA